MMTKFDKLLAIAVMLGFFLAFLVWIYFVIKGQYSADEMKPYIVMLIVLAVLFVGDVVLCIKHKNDPEIAEKKARQQELKRRLAKTEGAILSGLPIVTTPNAEINLFPERVEFSIYVDRYGNKRQNYNLDLNKITKVQRLSNTQNTSIMSKNAGNTVISGTFGNGGNYQDILVFEYLDNAEEKRIVVNVASMSGISKFMRRYEKIKPQSNSPVEL